MQTRRDFILTLGAFTAGASFSPRVFAARRESKTKLSSKPIPGVDGAYYLGRLEQAGNVLAVKSKAGPLVIDAKHAYMAKTLLADVHGLVDAPPALLINTHHHADHSGGNWIFNRPRGGTSGGGGAGNSGGGAQIIAHKNLNPRLAANVQRHIQTAQGNLKELQRDGDAAAIKEAQELLATIETLKPEDFAAKREVSDGATIIDHGGQRIELYHYGAGHTDNDLVIFLPTLNIMHMGDLLFNELHPFIDRGAKANSTGWQNSLRQAMKLGDEKTIVIPGHGELTDKTALPKMVEYFDQLREIVQKAIKEGKSKQDIAAMKPDEFRGRGFEQLQGMALSAMYDELSEGAH